MSKISKKTGYLWLQVLIALILIPAYQYLGEGFKYVVAPYVLYMVWARDPIYFPALIIHIAPGTTITSFILLLTLILSIYHLPTLRKMKISWLLWLSLLPLPIFLSQTYNRLFIESTTFIQSIIPLSFYLGIFPFFYGIVLGKKMTTDIWRAILIVLFILPVFQPVITNFTFRHYWFSFPLFLAIILLTFFKDIRNRLGKWDIILAIGFFLIVVTGFLDLRFTLIFSGFFTFSIAWLFLRGKKIWLSFFTKARVVILSIVLVAIVINRSDTYGNIEARKGINRSDLSYRNLSDITALLSYKAFDDRGTIWAGGWRFLKVEGSIWPPMEVPAYSYETNTGVVFENVNYGIHNIGLELVRNYGFLVGILEFIIYVIMLLKSAWVFRLKRLPIYLILFGSSVLGVGIIGGIVGQFVLMSTFSFLLMGICGICYSYFIMEHNSKEFRFPTIA